jgi:hypothetical protein
MVLCLATASCGDDDEGVGSQSTGGSGGVPDSGSGGTAGGSGGSSAGAAGTGGVAGNAGDAGRTITVAGKVLDAYEVPLPGMAVRIGALLDVTDAGGKFAFTGVSVPYTAIAVNGEQAVIYEGLTRSDPTLHMDRPAQSPFEQAFIKGTMSGGAGFPDPPGHFHSVAFSSEQSFDWIYSGSTAGSSGTYQLYPAWPTPDSTQLGTVLAFQYQGVTAGHPTLFTGFGTTPVTIAHQTTANVPPMQLGAIGTDTLTGTITFSGTMKDLSVRVYAVVDVNTSTRIPSDHATLGAFSVVVPSGQSLKAGMAAVVNADAGFSSAFETDLAAPVTALNLEPPEIATLQSPIESTDEVGPGGTFTVAPIPTLKRFLIADGLKLYEIWTMNDQVSVPDLSGEGLAWGEGTSAWKVTSVPSWADVDSAAGPTGISVDRTRVLYYLSRAGRSAFRLSETNYGVFTSVP